MLQAWFTRVDEVSFVPSTSLETKRARPSTVCVLRAAPFAFKLLSSQFCLVQINQNGGLLRLPGILLSVFSYLLPSASFHVFKLAALTIADNLCVRQDTDLLL